MADTTYTWDLVGRDRGASKAFKDVGRAADEAHPRAARLGELFGGALAKGIGVGVKALKAGAVGIAGLGAVAVGLAPQLMDMAVRAEAATNKFATVFGDYAGDMEQSADMFSEKLGMSMAQTKGLMAGFGDLLTPMGFTGDKLMNLTDQSTKLTAALSLWSNGTKSAADVADIMNDALTGQYDSLLSLGVQLDQDTIKQILHKEGKDKLTGAALKQATAEAALAEITRQSSNALTSYDKGTNKLAQSKLKLQANIEDLKDRIATALIPVFIAATTWASEKLVPALARFGDWMSSTGIPTAQKFAQEVGPKIVAAFKGVVSFGAAVLGFYRDHTTLINSGAVAIGTMVAALKTWQTATTVMKGAQLALNLMMAANPIGVVVVALAGIAAGLVYAYQTSESFRNGVHALWGVVRDVFASMVDKVLGFAGVFVHAADWAFGWIPGIGPKLHESAVKFDEFRDSVNRSLRGISDQDVAVKVRVLVNGRQASGNLIRSGGQIGVHVGSGTAIFGASGGIINRPTMLLAGEAGPEALVPLDKSAGNGPLPAAGLGGGDTYVLNYYGAAGANPKAQAEEIERVLRKGRSAGWRPQVLQVKGA